VFFVPQKAYDVVKKMAKLYNLQFHTRATDQLRNIDADTSTRIRFKQSVAEHGFFTSKMVGFILSAYQDVLENLALNHDRAIVLGNYHDDLEWRDGDMAPGLPSSQSPTGKSITEQESMDDLLDSQDEFLRQIYQECKELRTYESQLVKICDILELFCHNRILARYNHGIVTWENYKDYSPETWEESEYFLAEHEERQDNIPLTVAHILETKYFERFYKLPIAPALRDIFLQVAGAIRTFPFEQFIKIQE
jgi:5'-deoxynucleotidase YfbR-like HD superfamily hydrolase